MPLSAAKDEGVRVQPPMEHLKQVLWYDSPSMVSCHNKQYVWGYAVFLQLAHLSRVPLNMEENLLGVLDWSPIAVAAPEAGLVIDDSISGQEIYEMDGLLACLALVEGAAERHSERAQSPKPGNCKEEEERKKKKEDNGHPTPMN
ncbi:hypothetical protein GW17_00009789 [Ensete ventricosum]|uniref:Uncharacterized protein n=1 Tax=Ensete ventricosum TaxID=4639 RepID=A0A444FTE2_ENSVE|nr:hypothetical protein GW17_00009789 [Ensete ventricosum]RZR74434.1 hypothetical protein BHM03_00036943 [Ensete ventricosum]